MAFDNCNILDAVTLDFSMDDWCAKNLSNERKKVCEILGTFSDDAVNLYKAGIFVLQTDGFPAQQSIIAHCFRELINPIIRGEEEIMKQQAVEAIANIEFIKNGQNDPQKIKDFVDKSWANGLKPLHNERAKLTETFLDRNPKMRAVILAEPTDSQNRQGIKTTIESIINKVREAKGKIDKLRHCGMKLETMESNELLTHIQALEGYILNLENPQYLEIKEVLDGILEDANARAD